MRTALARKSPGGRSGISELDRSFQKRWRINVDFCRLATLGSHVADPPGGTSIAPTAASSQQPPTGDFWQGRQPVHSFTKSHKATSTGKVLLFPPVITLSPGYHADLTFISPFWRFYGSPLSSRLCQNYAPPGQTCSGEPPPGDCPAFFAPRTTGQE